MDIAQTAPDTVILAEDEASLYLQATLHAVWAPVAQTPCIRLAPDRDLTHFYGTLNLLTGQETLTRTDTLSALVTTHHLQQLVATYPGKPLLLLWDRASWHHGPPMTAFLAEHPQVDIFIFPTATPELNPQEQVWKDARDAVSHNHTYARLPEVADAFEAHLEGHKTVPPLLAQYGFTAIRSRFI